MPYAITLRLDSAASARVVAIAEALIPRGRPANERKSGYPPHLTIAIVPDSDDRERLLAAVRMAAPRWRTSPVKLASLGIFPGEPATIFLAPIVTTALLSLHADVLKSLAGQIVDPHYQRDEWVPHVTLDVIPSAGVPAADARVATLMTLPLPIDAAFDTIEVVRFPPAEILASHPTS